MQQDIGARFITILTDESFLAVLAKGLEIKKALLLFASQILEGCLSLTEEDAEFAELWGHEMAKPLRESLGKFESLARAIFHFFCEDVPGGVVPTTDDDILTIANYAGQHHVERVG